MYRLAYSAPGGGFGTLIASAPDGQVWPAICTAVGWDNAEDIVRKQNGGVLLAVTPISDGRDVGYTTDF